MRTLEMVSLLCERQKEQGVAFQIDDEIKHVSFHPRADVGLLLRVCPAKHLDFWILFLWNASAARGFWKWFLCFLTDRRTSFSNCWWAKIMFHFIQERSNKLSLLVWVCPAKRMDFWILFLWNASAANWILSAIFRGKTDVYMCTSTLVLTCLPCKICRWICSKESCD